MERVDTEAEDKKPEGPPLDDVAKEAVNEFEQMDREIPDDDSPGQQSDTGPKMPQISTADMLAGLYTPMAATLAPEWKLTAQEIQMLAQAHGAALDHYFPDGIDLGPLPVAVITTAMVIAPRIGQPMRKPKPKKQPPQDDGGES